MQVAKPKKGYKLVKWYFGKHLEIPEGWEIYTINDVAAKDRFSIVDGPFGSNLKITDYDPNGTIPVLTIGLLHDISQVYHSRCINEKKFGELKRSKIISGDIVIAKIGNTYGINCIYPKNFPIALIPANMCKITPDNNQISTKYLYYWINGKIFKNDLDVIVSTSAQPAFSIKELKKLYIPLPPLLEQKQITSILSNVGDTLQKTNQIIEQTQRLKKGMMQKLLTRGIGHTKFKEVSLIPNYIRIKIPDSWKVISLGEIAKLQGGFAFKSEDYIKNGIQLLKIANVSHSEFLWNEQSFVPNSFWEKYPEFRLNKNDIIIALTRPIISSGLKIGILDSNVKCLLNQRVGRFIVKPNMDLKYLFYFLNLQYIIDQIKFRTAENLQPNISTDEFEKILVWIPNNLPEQKQIASILSNVDTQIQKEKLHKSNLERLKKGLMQKLLTGQIRVKVR